ncbi:reverse transcriptase domain-containing protein [Tanacetum coccineum]
MCVDFTNINKACPKDCYPLPEIDWKVESLSGFRLKCFLDAYKATYQRLVDKVFSDQIGRNLKAYDDDMVIKSISEDDMLKDIHETFKKFQSINMKLNPKKCSFGVEEGPFLGHLITKKGIRANPSKIKAVIELEQPKTLKDIQSLNGKLAALSQFLSRGAERSLPFFKILKSCTDKKSIQWTQEVKESLQKMKKFMEILPTLTAPMKGESLTMYLTASTESIGASLFAKRDKRQLPIYFVSRVLQRVKLNYPALEKLILALVHATRRLRRTNANQPEGKKYTYALSFEFKTTNNEAEYKGAYKARQPIINEYLKKTKEVLRSFYSYTIKHVQKNQNKKADALSKLDLMTFKHLTKEVLVEVLTKRSIDNKEVLQVEVKEGESWMTSIHEYLLSGLLPEDLKEPMKIIIKSPQYKLIKGSLYKKSFFIPWLCCIVPPQVNNIIKEIHEGNTKLCKMQGTVYGQESSEERSNSSRKRMAIQPMRSQHSKALLTAPGGLKFGVPQIIYSKEEKHFKEGIFADLCTGLKITQSFSPTIEHTKIMNHIEKQLTRSQQGWVDDLARVLWVYRTRPRNSQKDTPFSLTYGFEAIIPTTESFVPKDNRRSTKENAKRKESKEVALIEEVY